MEYMNALVVAAAYKITKAREGRTECVADDEIMSVVGPARRVPSSDQASEICLTAWEPGFLKISAMRTIRHFSGLGLLESKSLVDEVLGGKTVSVRVAAGDVEVVKLLLHAMGARTG
jgi:ribosomal protein L7/L12